MNDEIINNEIIINELLGDFIFKVNAKSFTDEIGVSRTVTGIKAKIIGNIECNLSEEFSRTFYIAFVLNTGVLYGERNASTDEFIARMIQAGADEATAKANVFNICKNLEYGTKEQKYNAGNYLANAYGYELQPIENQN